jgi:hypothetical protein
MRCLSMRHKRTARFVRNCELTFRVNLRGEPLPGQAIPSICMDSFSYMRQAQVNTPPEANDDAGNCNQKFKEVSFMHRPRLIWTK